MEKELLKSGKILEKTLAFAKKIVKKEVMLLDIVKKIEEFIIKQKAKPAFPVNLSINDIAAHYSPFPNDKAIAYGLIKIDIGVNYNGYITDAAITIDLENSKENKRLIRASKEALKQAIRVVKPEIEVWEIGKAIEEKIKEYGFKPIYNLSGHSIDFNNLHAGKSIPNYNNKEKTKITTNEIIAIEPFATSGIGYVIDGNPSSIWILKKQVKPRLYREIYNFIKENFNGLPFSERWLSFSNYKIALNYFKQQGIMHNYSILIEKNKGKVSQYETTLLVNEKPKLLVDVFEI